jgi:hypothetical protein
MFNFLREGGVPMVFVLLFGLAGLSTAAYAAYRPTASVMAFIKWINNATLFAILSGMVGGFGAVFHGLGEMSVPVDTKMLLIGLGECMSLGIVGFTAMSLTCLLSAVAARKLVHATDV